VTETVREAVRMGLTCTDVHSAEDLTPGDLDGYELVFAPGLRWLAPSAAQVLCDWVEAGGVVFASGAVALRDRNGKRRVDFADEGLLGLHVQEGPISIFSALTEFSSGDIACRIPLSEVLVCESASAEAVAYGEVGAQEGVPLLWHHRIGSGNVFYLSGSAMLKSETNEADAWRRLVLSLLCPYLNRRPFTTTMEYPAEVWFNHQPERGRRVMHLRSFDRTRKNVEVAIRSDLVAGRTLHVVYPAVRACSLKGGEDAGYVRFVVPEVSEYMVLTIPE
jgi:hypothetical protein